MGWMALVTKGKVQGGEAGRNMVSEILEKLLTKSEFILCECKPRSN